MAERMTILTPGPRQACYWAITDDTEATGRHLRQIGPRGEYAVVRLRLEIDFGLNAVVFTDRLDKRDLDAGVYETFWAEILSEVAEGVRQALVDLSPDGAPIQALRVTLLQMKVHPIDSAPRLFRQAATLAVTEAIGRVGLVEGPT